MRLIWIFCIFSCFINRSFATPLIPPKHLYENWFKVDQHPGFSPFISHIDFRRISDFAIDQSTEYFDPDWVKQGDIIYVNVWFLPWFEKHVHDQIKHPYILISCDVGDHIPNPRCLNKILYDPKCAAWFCKNMVFTYHPKLHQIPWGQDIWFWSGNPNIIEHLTEATRHKPFIKKHLLYMNHFPRSFGDRDKIIKLFENAPYCFSRNKSDQLQSEYFYLPYSEYYNELASSVFVLSPFGLETDSVRTWEAFVLDCIPIVEHTFLDPQYEGMPILIVHDWEEISEKFLLSKFEELKTKSVEKAYFQYWHQEIKECQDRIRKNDLSFSYLEASKFAENDLQDLLEILKNHGNPYLIYRGFLATLRPLEIAKSLNSIQTIFFYDPWQDSTTWSQLELFLTDRSLLESKNKISFLTSDDLFNETINCYKTCPIFLDMTYYRNGLVIDANNFRHSLKKDLNYLYKKIEKGTLLCGNMMNNTYVKEVLEMFGNENNVNITTQGSFWLFIK